jgi:hypothetical protein
LHDRYNFLLRNPPPTSLALNKIATVIEQENKRNDLKKYEVIEEKKREYTKQSKKPPLLVLFLSQNTKK